MPTANTRRSRKYRASTHRIARPQKKREQACPVCLGKGEHSRLSKEPRPCRTCQGWGTVYITD